MGYGWWYCDVDLDDDGSLVAVVFDAFPFLPGRSDPALQIELYREGRRALSVMAIGDPSWTLAANVLTVHAWAAFPGVTVRGRIEVDGPPAGVTRDFGGHRWELLVARGTADVKLGVVTGRGTAYVDRNADDRPMPRALRRWTWLRTHGRDATTIGYQVDPGGGLVVRADPDGQVVDVAPATIGARGRQRPSAFGIPLPRHLVVDGTPVALGRPCLTAPFYVRLPTWPRGLAEIGRPRAIAWPGFRHLVAMRPTGPGGHPEDGDRVLHRAERLFLRRPRP